MKCFCEFFLIFFVVKTYAQRCTTPLGRRSQCVSIFQCPGLSSVFNQQRQLSEELVDFLRDSKCGYEGYTPKVCCGPLPSRMSNPNNNQYLLQQGQPSREPNRYNVREDPVSYEDSFLSPRGECGIDRNGDRIVGGNVTDLDEYPWMALLGYRNTEGKLRYECGGALINHRYVLTAAHCVVGAIEVQVGKLVTVRLGEYNTQTDRDCIKDDCADPLQEIPLKATYPHPGYSENNRNKANDIGLVRLAQRARYTFFVQPICLIGPSSPKLYVGDSLVVAGWGKTESGRKSPVKLKVEVPMYNKKSCDNKYRSVQIDLTYTQICAGGQRNEDSCRGDSGGPLMRRLQDLTWESIGLVSFGNGCGKPGWPGVYTAIAGFLDWIQDTMESSNTY